MSLAVVGAFQKFILLSSFFSSLATVNDAINSSHTVQRKFGILVFASYEYSAANLLSYLEFFIVMIYKCYSQTLTVSQIIPICFKYYTELAYFVTPCGSEKLLLLYIYYRSDNIRQHNSSETSNSFGAL